MNCLTGLVVRDAIRDPKATDDSSADLLPAIKVFANYTADTSSGNDYVEPCRSHYFFAVWHCDCHVTGAAAVYGHFRDCPDWLPGRSDRYRTDHTCFYAYTHCRLTFTFKCDSNFVR